MIGHRFHGWAAATRQRDGCYRDVGGEPPRSERRQGEGAALTVWGGRWRGVPQLEARAAARMIDTTAFGWETITACDEWTVLMCA